MRSFAVIFLLCLVQQLAAQRIRAGLSAGPTVNDIAGTDTRTNNNNFHKVGFTAGALANAEINKKTSFQFEINYSLKGSLQPPDSANNGYFNITVKYIEIPLLLKRKIHFTMNKKSMDRFELEGGVSIGRLIGKPAVVADNYPVTDAEKNFNKTVADIVAGVNFSFTKNISLGVRYSNSFIPAVKRNALDPAFFVYTFNQGNNMSFQFMFKVVFGKVSDIVQTSEPANKS